MISTHYNTKDVYTVICNRTFYQKYKILPVEINNSELGKAYIKIEIRGSGNKKFDLKIIQKAFE